MTAHLEPAGCHDLPPSPCRAAGQRLDRSIAAALAIVAALTMATALAGCQLPGPVIGPPELDADSADAPRCEPQVYPPNARMRGDRGTARVRARVDVDGRVTDATLVESTLDTDLDVASVAAVRRCRFPPASTAAGAPRDADVLVAWDLIASPLPFDSPVVRIGLRREVPK